MDRRILVIVAFGPICGLPVNGHFFLIYTTPLFEEEGNICSKALVSYINSPFGFHRPCIRAGFAGCGLRMGR